MTMWQMIKFEPRIVDLRTKMAADYRRIRKEDRAKALMLFKRMLAARLITERAVQNNLY